MPSIDISLGTLDLESRESGWQARAHSGATFTASEEDDLIRLSQQLTTGVLSDYSDELPWIIRSPTFRLVIVLRPSVLISADMQETTVATLAAHLRAAKFWDQLHLKPTVLEISSSESDERTISLSLDYVNHSTERSARHVHKLDIDVPKQDVRLPSGVPVVSIAVVSLDFHFDRRSQSKRRKIGERIPETYMRNVNFAQGFTGHSLPVSNLYDGRAGSSPIEDCEDAFDSDAWLLVDDHDALRVDDTTWLEEADYKSLDATFDQGDTSSCKRRSSESTADIDTQSSSMHIVLSLVDSAVRSCLLGSRRQAPRDVVVMATESLQPLLALMPSLWQPGYLANVSSRSAFIPAISRAIATVCQLSHGSHAKTFQEASSEAQKSRSESRTPLSSAKVNESPATQLSTRIWHLLCRSLYRSKPSKQLLPLWTPVSEADLEVTDEAETLDLRYWDIEGCTIGDEDDMFLDYSDDKGDVEGYPDSAGDLIEDEMLSMCSSLELFSSLEPRELECLSTS